MPVRIGVIGCGAIGQRRHIPEIVGDRRARLSAVCDVNSARVKQVADKFGCAAYIDYRVMLRSCELDAVVVATPNAVHARQTIDALNAGRHVLVEKPMAGNLNDARSMIAAAKKSKRILMVGQNQRLMPPHVKAKEILDSGKLGRPLAFQTTFKHPGPDGWSLDGARSWFFKKPQAIMGVCGDLGVHKADLMRFLLNDEVAQVSGFVGTLDKKDPSSGKLISVDDNAFIAMKMRSGVLGTMTISWTNYGGIEDNGTTIFCEKGVLAIGTDPVYNVIVYHKDGRREKFKAGRIATNTRQVTSGIMKMFVDSIVKETQPPIDGLEGYKSLEVIVAAMESARTGRAVKIRG